MMHSDPAKWSIEDVRTFFQHEAPRVVPDFAEELRAASSSWLSVITRNKLNGARLLSHVTATFVERQKLEDTAWDIGILECVQHVRDRHEAIASQNLVTPPPQEPPPSRTTNVRGPALPLPVQAQESAATVLESHEDRPVKKRRIATLETITQPVKKSSNIQSTTLGSDTRYMPAQPLTANDIFYGETASGAEIEYTTPSTRIQLATRSDLNEKEFRFTVARTSQSESQFAWRHMKHFLLHQNEVQTTRGGRNAVYILPYRPATSEHPSATVFRSNGHKDYIAVREDVFEDSSGDLTVAIDQKVQEDVYSHLLVKYADNENEEPLPLLTASEDGYSIASQSLDDTASISSNEIAEEDEEVDINLDEKQMTIQEMEKSIEIDWQANKLPKLEAQKAGRTWDKMKQSRYLRNLFIEASHQRIADLKIRLADMRSRLLMGPITDKQDILDTSGAFEPTIQDILTEKWKIDVYNRRHRPDTSSMSKQYNQSHRQVHRTHQSSAPVNTLRIDPIDRFTPPLPPSQQALDDGMKLDMEAGASDTDLDNVEMPDAVIKAVSPDAAETTSQDAFIVSDDSYEPMEIDTPSRPTTAVHTSSQRKSSVKERTLSPSQHSDIGKSFLNRMQEQGHVLDRTPTQDQVAPQSKAVTKSASIEIDDSDDDDLFADASTFIQPPRKKTSIVDPSLSSPATQQDSKRKSNVKSYLKRATQSADMHDPYRMSFEKLTSNLINQLDFNQLAANKDRRKMMLKLIHDESIEFRDSLYRARAGSTLDFQKRVIRCLEVLASGKSVDQLFPDPDIMIKAAHLFVAFFNGRYKCYINGPTLSEMADAALDNTQIVFFASQLWQLLERKDTVMFDRTTKPAQTSSSMAPKVHHISSDEEESDMEMYNERDPRSHKKKRRPVEKSAAARKTRQAAHERAEQFSQRQVSQGEGGSQTKTTPSDGKDPLIEVNPLQSSEHAAIHIDRQIARGIKEHQVKGVQFMWRELTAQDDEKVKGCLLAHAMGLGKTMQAITVLIALSDAARSGDEDVYKQLPAHLEIPTGSKRTRFRVLILCPASLINNWAEEISKWDTKKTLGSTFRLDTETEAALRHQVLSEWNQKGGVMLVSYEMYRRLTKPTATTDDSATPAEPDSTIPVSADAEILQRNRELASTSADIAILDEAQNIKSHNSENSKSVARITAQSRIALTGTPLSNSIDEIYEIISWVAPGYLGGRNEFNYHYVKPIKDGLWQDAEASAKRKSRKKLAVLRNEIDPKYLRADITVLKHDLKPKVEYMLTVGMTELQTNAYGRFVTALKGQAQLDDVSRVTLFAWLNTLSLLTTHPWSFRKKLLTKRKPKATKAKANGRKSQLSKDTEDSERASISDLADGTAPGDDDIDIFAHGFTDEIARAVIGDLPTEIDLDLSTKTLLFYKILRASIDVGDKMLVFSHHLETLNYLEELLGRKRIPCYRIDGSVPANRRADIIQEFRDSAPGVMLISTRAGGVGLNIQCANRIVIFDAGFNPMHEQQAIGRAYRIGQPKPVYVYRFIVGGTFEINLENMQLHKITLADRVVDKKDYILHARKTLDEWLDDPKPIRQTDLTEWLGKDPDVLDKIIQGQLSRNSTSQSQIYAIKTTETLQVDADDEALNEEDQREVEQAILAAHATRRSARIYQQQGVPALSQA